MATIGSMPIMPIMPSILGKIILAYLALAAGVTVVIIGASIATGVTGSWLPGLATLGTLFMLGEFSRWYNSRKK